MENIQKVSLLFILSLLISSFQNIQGKEHKIEFKSLPPYINIPTDVQQIYQDRDGFIWFATRNGLNKYDGEKFTNLKSSSRTSILPEPYPAMTFLPYKKTTSTDYG